MAGLTGRGQRTTGAPKPSIRRVAIVMFAGASLVAGLMGALTLLGVPSTPAGPQLAGFHGALMTIGFLGTVIALERAVALNRPWGFAAPMASGFAGVLMMAGGPWALVTLLIAFAALVYLAIYVELVRLDRTLHTAVQATGAVGWVLAAGLLVTGRPVADAVPAIVAFLILTVAGERLELARLSRLTTGARRTFLAAAGLFAAGVIVALPNPDAGLRLGGVGLVAMALWLARHDIARRTVRIKGVTRFIALCLLAGYAWLAVGGAAWIAWGASAPALGRDAELHALFLGFVISMVFGHAPVILPAVLRVPLPYRPSFYAHLALLHAGLVLRVLVGDALGQTWAWHAGGVLTVSAMLLFVIVSATTVVGATRAMHAEDQRRTMRADRAGRA